jgi:enterochelin esterase family protein
MRESDNPQADREPGWLIRQFVEAERLPLNFYLDIGLLENKVLKSLGEGMSHHSMNRHMRDVLRAKGYRLTYVEYNGGHDYLWWRQTLADGLVALLATADQVRWKKT